MTRGEKIKAGRIAKNLTQKQFAEILKVKHNSISDWENDRYFPDVDTVEKICEVLSITPTYLVGKKPEEEYGGLVGNLINDPEILDMISQYKNLSKNDQSAIRQIISSLNRKSRE